MVFNATKYYKHVVDPTAGRQRHAGRKSIPRKKNPCLVLQSTCVQA